MTNVTVTDTLPDGMYFVGLSTVTCYKMDASTMSRTDEVLPGASVSISGQTLTVTLGDIDYPVEIEYSVHVPAQTSVHLRNHSEVTYTQDGTTYKEHRDYIAQSNDYSASNGVKSVDKTVISDDPADQWVTYTIKFWNENSFAAGEITLTDDLDDHVRFLYSDNNEYFELTVDEDGIIPVSLVLTKEGSTVTEAVFNNEKPVIEKTSVSGDVWPLVLRRCCRTMTPSLFLQKSPDNKRMFWHSGLTNKNERSR